MTARVAVVTGGLSGIGRACADALEQAGHQVAIGSRRGGEGALPLDVSDASSVAAFCDAVNARFGAPQILVNAAGISVPAELRDPDPDPWHSQIATNLTGPYLMIQALMPGMIASGWGRIVNIASTAAHVGAEAYGGYCASKAGLVALSRVAALEGAPHGVSCISVSPTWVETPMLEASAAREAAAEGTSAQSVKDAIAAQNPQNRLVQPQEVAAVVMLGCSEAAPALTNTDISVNAGAQW